MPEADTETPADNDSATVWVVMPAYNEGAVLAKVVGDVRKVYPHVVIIDDGSADDTYEIAKSTGAATLRHAINRGQGASLQTGIEYALRHGADYVVTFDTDGQHSVDDIAVLLEPLRAGRAEITLGSRFLGGAENIPPLRRLILRAAVFMTRIMSGLKVTDTHNGLRAFTRKAASRLHITSDRMAHASEIIDQVRAMDLPFVEVPVTIRYTDYSLEKGQTSRNAIRVLFEYFIGKVSK